MEWISITDKLPEDGQYILINCGLCFDGHNIAAGFFRKSKRNKYADRIQLGSYFGAYSEFISLDSVYYWMPVSEFEKQKTA